MSLKKISSEKSDRTNPLLVINLLLYLNSSMTSLPVFKYSCRSYIKDLVKNRDRGRPERFSVQHESNPDGRWWVFRFENVATQWVCVLHGAAGCRCAAARRIRPRGSLLVCFEMEIGSDLGILD